MSQFFSKISYIICYREASAERKQALHYVLRQLRDCFPNIEILIVEQDSEPKLKVDESLNIKHLYIYNSGLFNRSWAFNCAVNNTNKDIFVFADADIFLAKEGYIKCFNAAQYFEAITPNKREISNVSIVQNSIESIQFLNKRKLHSFAGGMLILTRSGFNKIGGWDERFEGWGGEDDAMSHLIYNCLKSKTFDLPNFHIDHPHEFITGNNHPQYESNKTLVAETQTRYGKALKRYIELLKSSDLGNPDKYISSGPPQKTIPLKFVLAITTFNRIDYLKNCVESFFETRNEDISWQLIIADDNSNDGTLDYLKLLQDNHNAIVIHNDQTNVHHQVNSIIKVLSNMTFDLCFRSDDDVIFLKPGWDKLYWKTIQRSGYQHLIFYDKNWQPYSNLSRPNRSGHLISNCHPENIQGAFYTLTKQVIEKVGYFDEQQFGASGMGHIDFSFRSCRAGFNVLANPFDVENSNGFIQLQAVNKYSSASSNKNKSLSNSKRILAAKILLLRMDRVFIPYNENFHKAPLHKVQTNLETRVSKRSRSNKFSKADATFYSERGISGFVGFVLKRIYNLSIDLKLYFIPLGINHLAKVLNKLSIHLLNIEK